MNKTIFSNLLRDSLLKAVSNYIGKIQLVYKSNYVGNNSGIKNK